MLGNAGDPFVAVMEAPVRCLCFPALWRWILINRFIQMTLSRRFPVYEKECTLITIQINLFMDLLTLKRKGGTWTCGYVYLCSELYAFCVPVLSSGMMMQIPKLSTLCFHSSCRVTLRAPVLVPTRSPWRWPKDWRAALWGKTEGSASPGEEKIWGHLITVP